MCDGLRSVGGDRIIFIGSVSNYVISHASCSLLIVREG
ncbi:universal stress protein [Fischerella thermalis]